MLFRSIVSYDYALWLPDGKQIIFAGNEAGHLERIYVQQIDSESPHAVTPEGVGGVFYPSPDGKSLIARDAQGKAAIYSVEGNAPPRPIAGFDDKDAITAWSGDGRLLYVYSWSDGSLKISSLDLATGRKEPFKELIPADRAGIFYPPAIFLTPDGKGYVYSVRRYLMDLYLVDGLK